MTMNRIARSILLLLLYSFLSTVLVCPGAAEDLALVNRPVNTSGLTGILFTTAPYTIPRGTIETGVSVMSESSVTPDYTIIEYPLTFTLGLTSTSELALRGSYYNIKEGPTVTAPVERRAGNVELSYKWNFLPQVEGSWKPPVSLILSGFVPLENNSNVRINAETHWGMRIGISTGTEITWRDHVLAVYADGQLAGQDVTEKRLRDIYEIVNAGLLFPISKYQNLQMLLEYSLVHGKEVVTIDGGDYSALTYGLRLVSERFNLTIGSQFLRKSQEGYDNSARVVGLMSMKY